MRSTQSDVMTGYQRQPTSLGEMIVMQIRKSYPSSRYTVTDHASEFETACDDQSSTDVVASLQEFRRGIGWDDHYAPSPQEWANYCRRRRSVRAAEQREAEAHKAFDESDRDAEKKALTPYELTWEAIRQRVVRSIMPLRTGAELPEIPKGANGTIVASVMATVDSAPEGDLFRLAKKQLDILWGDKRD